MGVVTSDAPNQVTRERTREVVLCVLFWVAVIVTTHDLFEAKSCLVESPNHPTVTERVISFFRSQ